MRGDGCFVYPQEQEIAFTMSLNIHIQASCSCSAVLNSRAYKEVFPALHYKSEYDLLAFTNRNHFHGCAYEIAMSLKSLRI